MVFARISLLVSFAVVGTPLAADPSQWRAEEWGRTDFSRTSVAWEDIKSGGPPKDGIPPIDAPRFKPATEISDIADLEPVIGLDLAGDARAYPLRVLIWHEIANDTVGGIPVAVTYCPLCNAAIVFDRRVEGATLDFGTTGKLRNSDLIMYDRQSESWWQQFTGEAIVGAMLGKRLELIPARLESFGEFKARSPAGKVLVPNDPSLRPYGSNPYVGYDSAKAPFLYDGEMPNGIEPMARVVVVRAARSQPLIMTLEHLRAKITIELGNVRVAWKPGQASALDSADVGKGRDIGTISAEVASPDGSRVLVPFDVTFAFVAHAFHPDVAIVKD